MNMSGTKNTAHSGQSKSSGLQTRFLIGLAAILIVFSAIASTAIYFQSKNRIEEDAFRQAELVMTAMEANRSYVREVLRPKMYRTIDEDNFIIEAMSSSYISRAVMDRFQEKVSDFNYRRVAINARNPDFEAKGQELEMIRYFNENPEISEWHGITVKDENRYFMHFRPVKFRTSCFHCHGDPEKAPATIIDTYGEKRGFFRKADKVIGVISVGLSVEKSLIKVKETAISVFISIFPSILLLYAIISVFFNRIIVQNLKNLVEIFRTTLKDEKNVPLLEVSQSMDEIDELTSATESIAEQLRANRIQLENYAAQILQSKELLQSVFDGIADPVILMTCDGRIRMVNNAFLKRYDMKIDQIVHHRFDDLPDPTQCPVSRCKSIIEQAPKIPVSKQVQLDSGEIFFIYFYPIMDENSQLDSLVCYVKDITEQKQLELKMQQTEKMVSMGQLAAGVAHELNNPLGVILCHLDLLKDNPRLTDDMHSDLKIIERHTGNCKIIISDLLNFARQSKTFKEIVSINMIINDVIAIATKQLEKQNIHISFEQDEAIPHFELDINRMRQVMLNLLLNSCHAVSQNGHISIRSSYSKADNNCVITVEDDGYGIRSENIDKIFDPFFTTKETGEGTGLGLSISYGIIKDHEGDIQVSVTSTGMTRFTIILPLHGSGSV